MEASTVSNFLTGSENHTEVESYYSFPVDTVWLNVFEKLNNQDKHAFSQVCPEWHDWVGSKRTQFLMSELPLMETLEKPDLLECRKLCRSWVEVVDHKSQTHQLTLCLDSEIGAVERDEIPELINNFSSSEQIQGFIEDMRTNPGNPFPGRSIELGINAEFRQNRQAPEWIRIIRDYWNNVRLLLELWGINVHYAHFDFDDSFPLGVEKEVHLRSCLLLLPNLKRVSIWGNSRQEAPSDQIREHYRLNVLPRLEDLETVKIHYMHSAMFDAFLSSCCIPAKIKHLKIHTSYGDRIRLFETVYNFENLEVLRFECEQFFVEDLQRFRNVEQLPPLKEIYLTFEETVFFTPSFNNFFEALEPFADTLVHVETTAVEVSSYVVARRDRINLPNLKRLWFYEYTGPLDPLIQFRQLTHLTIRNFKVGMGHRRENDVVELYGFESRMYDSNIWRLIPSLETLVLPSRTYKRDIYKQTAAI